MPYRHAHWFLLLLFPLTGLAFWQGYFSVLSSSPTALHVHGITASLWIVLLAAQSWLIQNRYNHQHRLAGYASFVLFPLFISGGLLVVQTMAIKTNDGSSPFYAVHGPGLGALDLIATAAILALVYDALKHRRQVHRHGAAMLCTVLFLISPIVGRLFPILPPLAITGPDTFYKFAWSVHLGNLTALLIALVLYRRHPRGRTPFLLTAVALALQSVAMALLVDLPMWRRLFAGIAALPLSFVAALGLAAGAAIILAGWFSTPARPERRTATG